MAINWEQGFRKGRMKLILLWTPIAAFTGLVWMLTHKLWWRTTVWLSGPQAGEKDTMLWYWRKGEPKFGYVELENTKYGYQWHITQSYDPEAFFKLFIPTLVLGTIIILLLPVLAKTVHSLKSGFSEGDQQKVEK